MKFNTSAVVIQIGGVWLLKMFYAYSCLKTEMYFENVAHKRMMFWYHQENMSMKSILP